MNLRAVDPIYHSEIEFAFQAYGLDELPIDAFIRDGNDQINCLQSVQI